MRFCLLLLLGCFQVSQAQDEVSVLIDSLAGASSPVEKTHLSLSIAEQLQHSNWSRAIHFLDVAKETATTSNSDSLLAEVNMVAGDMYSNKDALDIALENYLKAYDYYEDKKPSERFRLENNLAIVYARSNNEESALTYFDKVYQYQLAQKDSLVLAQILNNMGNLYLGKNADSALTYFEKAEQLAAKINNPDLSIYVQTNLGRSYLKKNEMNKARASFQKALNTLSKTTNVRTVSFLNNEMAQFYAENKQLDSALLYAKKVVAANDTLAPFSFEQQDAVELVYKSLLEKGAYKEASTYFEKFNQIRDSLALEDKLVNVERVIIEEKYRNKDKIRELEEGKQRARNYMILLALLVALVILGALLLRYRAKLKNTILEKQLATAKQKELNTQLQLKNKELVGKAMIELHRTEIIEEILTDLKSVRLKAAKRETQNAIDYVVKRLKRDTNTNLWEEFELRFEQVHESFYKNLITKHPDLTPKDKRLCALLKLNLTSKEIAQITGQTAKSVENARTRLRKKLDITHSETDLSAYLFSFD
ncbi:tetratricopeptide repeat protein [Marinirhabdus gelatinilytica]|uniref:Tetratricopeptide repeat protein n=1 Tax=Marinirhabdus gelatinilytica TaxID=1703343 RepID=A0A370Q602_9FLAO|nr:tetratricopeptide repeat protein [Marinirhabdus gelatinilytica]RDK83795.1 tetratricopeptide repeat protein [Marinirhabdus gelatinilytica]